MSILKTIYLQHLNGSSPNATLDANGNMIVTGTVAGGYSDMFRNRIINGDMRIDQRNTAATTNVYTVDRWQFGKFNDATESVAQNTDAPAGFSYSLRNTISVGDASIGAAQYSAVLQPIEGYNVADLGFGTSNARTITLSFWVKATQTGTYSAVLQGGSPQRRVFKAFSVSASNTWEYKTLTFLGDTNTGSTWNSTNGIGLSVQFYFALGSNFLNGTDGTWAASSTNNYGPSGMTNGIGTNGNIYAITGVQLEVGTVATAFERRPYGMELQLCQRYCQWVPFSMGFSSSGAGTFLNQAVPFQTIMRAVPTMASIVADPDATQANALNASNSFNANYTTVRNGLAGLGASGPGNCFVYGYRSLATAEL